jgi:hypothetical protein
MKTHLYALSICLISVGVSCAVLQEEYRAHIDSDQHWKMVETCGFEGCYPMVDVLIGNGTRARFDFYKIQRGQLIFVKVTFLAVKEDLTFDPAKITATLSGQRGLPVKGFRCANIIWDLQVMRHTPSVESPVQVSKNDCYILFIDYQGLTQETIAMNINSALTLNGRSMGVPVIYFKRNPEFKK